MPGQGGCIRRSGRLRRPSCGDPPCAGGGDIEQCIGMTPPAVKRAPASQIAPNQLRHSLEHAATQAIQRVYFGGVKAHPFERQGAKIIPQPTSMQDHALGVSRRAASKGIGPHGGPANVKRLVGRWPAAASADAHAAHHCAACMIKIGHPALQRWRRAQRAPGTPVNPRPCGPVLRRDRIRARCGIRRCPAKARATHAARQRPE